MKYGKAIEPFDDVLNDNLRKIYGDFEHATIDVTNKRRLYPNEIINNYDDFTNDYFKQIENLKNEIDSYELKVDENENKQVDLGGSGNENDIENEWDIPRIQQIIKDYENSIIALKDLKSVCINLFICV